MRTFPHKRSFGSAIAAVVCATALLGSVALFGSACDPAREFSGVFVEDVVAEGLNPARNTAFRMTVYEFADSVGGFIEYYEIAGLNTMSAPYTKPTSCAYFGPVRRSQETVRFDAMAPNGTDTVRIELDSVKRRAIGGILIDDGGTVNEPGADDESSYELYFIEDGRRTPAMSCPDNVVLLGAEP